MRKVQLTIKQEEVAPATTSDLVVMNNGKTLKEELSTNVLNKFSREVTVNNSMSKVIDGTLDGVYESGVMYGRSLVNLAISLNREVPCTFTKKNLSSRCLLASCMSLTADKTYVAIVELGNMFLDNLTSMDFMLQINPSGGSSYSVRSNGHTSGNKKIYIKFNARYDSTAGIEFKGVATQWEDNADGSPTLDVKNYMVLEYQQGMENWDIPYFTGLCDVKMPILRNVGKNLLELNDTALVKTAGTNNLLLTKKNGGLLAKKDSCVKGSAVIYIEIPNAVKGRKYQFSATITSTNMNRALSFYGGNTAYTFLVNNNGRGDGSRVVSDICTFNPSWDKFCIVIGDHGTLTEGANISIEISDLCVWEVDTKQTSMPYEDYKTNILRTSEEIVLREVGGVCDTYNPLTGEYVRRIGEIVLDGSENWVSWGAPEETDVKGFAFTSNIKNNNSNGNTVNYVSDKFNGYSRAKFPHMNCVGVCDSQTQGNILIKLKKTDVPNGTVSECKVYLQAHPFTVQYKLAEPITTIVEPLTIPFAYENGHIILESGSEEQSLLPELKYSVPASKNGVISTTSNTILKHEQHLHKFEDLLLRESILMDYRLTLSFLDKM